MLERVTILLFVGMIFFAVVIVFVARTSPTDGQTFQIMAGAFNSLLGAFLTKIIPSVIAGVKGNGANGKEPPPSSGTAVSSDH